MPLTETVEVTNSSRNFNFGQKNRNEQKSEN